MRWPNFYLYCLFLFSTCTSFIFNYPKVSLAHFVIWNICIYMFLFSDFLLILINNSKFLMGLKYSLIFISIISTLEFYLSNYRSIFLDDILHYHLVTEYRPTFMGKFYRSRTLFEESNFQGMWVLSSLYILHIKRMIKIEIALMVLLVNIVTTFSVSLILSGATIILINSLHKIRLNRLILSGFFIAILLRNAGSEILIKLNGYSALDRMDKVVSTLKYMQNATLENLVLGYGPGSFQYVLIEPSISVLLNSFRDYGILGLLVLVLILVLRVIELKNPLVKASGVWLILVAILTSGQYWLYFIYWPLFLRQGDSD